MEQILVILGLIVVVAIAVSARNRIKDNPPKPDVEEFPDRPENPEIPPKRPGDKK